MKYFAIVSDIHANRPALESVICDAEEIAGMNSLSFINLGDVVDYGPHPNDCMKKIIGDDRFILNVCGNHDEEAGKGVEEPIMMVGEHHWAFTLWTRKELLPKFRDVLKITCRYNHVSTDPIPELHGFSFIHGGLDGHFNKLAISDVPTTKRIKNTDDAKYQFRNLGNRSAFVGHTHYQGYFVSSDFEDKPAIQLAVPSGYLNGSHSDSFLEISQRIDWQKFPEQQFILNPGSVGQPRWHSIIKGTYPKIYFPPMACYVMVRVGSPKMEFAFRQVDYDYQTTIYDLQRIKWPENATKRETEIVAQHFSKEHSAYRQQPEINVNISYLEKREAINKKLQLEIKNLICAIDPTQQQE